MESNLSITVFNILPERPTIGYHVPFHTVIQDPLRYPFTFGPNRIDVRNGSHIGLESGETIAGAFIGTEGEFLVLSADQFIVLTPKASQPTTLGSVLFPKREHYDIQLAEKGKSYTIKVGSSIMAYNLASSPRLTTVSFFLGANNGSRDKIYTSALRALGDSLVYFNQIWESIVSNPIDTSTLPTITLDAFRPTASTRETSPCMQVQMHAVARATQADAQQQTETESSTSSCGNTTPDAKRRKID